MCNRWDLRVGLYSGLYSHLFRYIFLVSILCLISTKTITLAESYMIIVDPGVESDCYHERAPIGTKLGMSFEVTEGGHYDIDCLVRDPNNVILHEYERISSGKITIDVTLDGPYTVCFSNIKGTPASKSILFHLRRLNATEDDFSASPAKVHPSVNQGDDYTRELNRMVSDLLSLTADSKHDVGYLAARDRVHRKLNETTNSMITLWCGVEFILLLVVAVGQVFYLRRFFEIRRKT